MIYETNEHFDFEKNILFQSPKSISGGNYVIKCLSIGNNPLYIQTPKGKAKQKLVKTGKKMYGDFVFTQDDESFLKWMEEFETLCQKTLFQHRAEWFDSALEMHDIENSFVSSLKSYKSGKLHALRANIPVRLGKCAMKIYDEQEQEMDPDNITENTNLITILEVQGIRCSSRSFQIEYEVKQILVLNPVDIFEKCILHSASISIQNHTSSSKKEKDSSSLEKHLDIPNSEVEEQGEIEEVEEEKGEVEEEQEEVEETKKQTIKEGELEVIDLSFPEENTEEFIQLKKRNEVYFEMYKEAKRKAKMAREYALTAYLEAKHIKNTYLMDEAMDSDEEEENEELKSDIFSLEKKEI